MRHRSLGKVDVRGSYQEGTITIMPVTKNVQKVGNSRGLILTTEFGHVGITDAATVILEGDRIVITKPSVSGNPRLRPGRNRQTLEEATKSTINQYSGTLSRLADASSLPEGAESTGSK